MPVPVSLSLSLSLSLSPLPPSPCPLPDPFREEKGKGGHVPSRKGSPREGSFSLPPVVVVVVVRSPESGLDLSVSWLRGHSDAYNAAFLA